MENFNAVVEFATQATSETRARLMDNFAAYNATAGQSDFGRLDLIITVPADNLTQATTAVLALVADRPVVRLEVLTAAEFERRRSLPLVPDLVSVAEAAHMLHISREHVLYRINAGALPGRKVGTIYAIPRSAVMNSENRAPTPVAP